MVSAIVWCVVSWCVCEAASPDEYWNSSPTRSDMQLWTCSRQKWEMWIDGDVVDGDVVEDTVTTSGQCLLALVRAAW